MMELHQIAAESNCISRTTQIMEKHQRVRFLSLNHHSINKSKTVQVLKVYLLQLNRIGNNNTSHVINLHNRTKNTFTHTQHEKQTKKLKKEHLPIGLNYKDCAC